MRGTIRRMCLLTAIGAMLAAVGCSRMELNERGFILGVAIDETEEGKIELTTQFYKPNEGTTAATPKKESSFNIRTTGDSVFEAVRDLTIHLGRKAQWSHMQAIIVGEDLARKKPLGDILDFFYRDSEPRLTTPIMIAKNKAAPYLKENPFIEKTISRQFRGVQESSSRFSAKSIDMNLLGLQNELNGEMKSAVMPFVTTLQTETKEAVVSGGALFKQGIMVGMLTPDQVQSYLMLVGRYQSGIVTVPCSKRKLPSDVESFEVQSAQIKVSPRIENHTVTAKVDVTIDGTMRELVCSSLQKTENHFTLQQKVAKHVERQLSKTIQSLQKQRADVIGIGDKLYQHQPRQWAALKKNWDEQFARVRFDYNVSIHITNTGLAGWNSTFGQ